jgi:hypothetical protein
MVEEEVTIAIVIMAGKYSSLQTPHSVRQLRAAIQKLSYSCSQEVNFASGDTYIHWPKVASGGEIMK